MMNIGEFARLGGVSTRRLRHYDAIGLLSPAHVDPHTGRRSYDVAQLPVLNRLVALKGLGFNLEEVGVLLAEGVDSAQMQGMLRLRRAELEREVRHARHVLDRVTARLRLIEQENHVNAQITTKQTDPLTIAGLTATAQDASRQSTGAVVQSLFEQVIEHMEAAGADRTTPIAHYVPDPDTPEVHVTAGYAVPHGSVPGLEPHTLPLTQVASTIHQGPIATISTAYQALAHWTTTNNHQRPLTSPTWREHYLEATGSDHSPWLIELQLELP
jgi:DNA-binding transcriptional MerR regulator